MNESSEIPQGPSLESTLVASIQDRVVSHTELEDFKAQNGFTNGHRGTWRSEFSGAYLYTKECHEVNFPYEAERSLRALRYMTDLGMIFPQTEWGISRTDDDKFQLYAVTRELPQPSQIQPEAGWQIPLARKGMSEEEWYKKIFNSPQSHILEWVSRLSAEKRGVKLVPTLNPFEASHLSNWAWDPSSGKLYPIDVEVISIARDSEQKAIEEWDNASENNI